MLLFQALLTLLVRGSFLFKKKSKACLSLNRITLTSCFIVREVHFFSRVLWLRQTLRQGSHPQLKMLEEKEHREEADGRPLIISSVMLNKPAFPRPGKQSI